MVSDLKFDLIMTTSQRGPNMQLKDNPAVVCQHSISIRALNSNTCGKNQNSFELVPVCKFYTKAQRARTRAWRDI